MKRFCITGLLVSVMLALAWMTIADSEPAQEALSFSAESAPEDASVPEQTPAPERTPAAQSEAIPGDPFTATLTPKATFVPLPTEKPRADGSTPTPAPPGATPYPSPEATLNPLPEKMLLGTITKKEVNLSSQPVKGSSRRGTVYKDDVVRILEEKNDWYKVETGNRAGWMKKSDLKAEEVQLKEAEHIVVRVGSFNIHSCRKKNKISQLGDLIASENLDVVGLQEATRSDYDDWVKKLAREGDYPYYYFTRTLRLKDREYGIAILSRYPMLRTRNFPLSSYKGDEPRTLQYADLLTEQGVIHFLNTHISAKEMYKKSYNLTSMVYHLRKLEGRKFFVTGDFNCGPPRIIEYWPEARFANMTENTYGDGSAPKIIDNVLYTEGIRVVHTDYKPIREITDHSLMVAELIFD